MNTYAIHGFGGELHVVKADKYFLDTPAGVFEFRIDDEVVAHFARHGVFGIVKVQQETIKEESA